MTSRSRNYREMVRGSKRTVAGVAHLRRQVVALWIHRHLRPPPAPSCLRRTERRCIRLSCAVHGSALARLVPRADADADSAFDSRERIIESCEPCRQQTRSAVGELLLPAE